MSRLFSKRLLVIYVVLAILAVVAGFFLSREKAYPVEIVKTMRGSIDEVVRMAGYIDSENSEQVMANTQGIISGVSIKIGSLVRRGQTLCEVRSPELRKNMLEMKAELMVANTKLALAATQNERELAEARKKFILANIYDIEETMYPKAHINGEVVDKTVQNGSKVIPGQVMFFLADTKKPILVARMEESYVQKVKVGQPVIISGDFLNEKTLGGKVTKVSGFVKRENGTFVEANCQIFNPQGLVLKHGAFADVDIIIDRHDQVVVIPRSAFITDPKPHVFIERNGRAYQRLVKFGIIGLRNVEILEGLNPGENVINFGNLNLKDGVKVEIRAAN